MTLTDLEVILSPHIARWCEATGTIKHIAEEFKDLKKQAQILSNGLNLEKRTLKALREKARKERTKTDDPFNHSMIKICNKIFSHLTESNRVYVFYKKAFKTFTCRSKDREKIDRLMSSDEYELVGVFSSHATVDDVSQRVRAITGEIEL